MKCYGCYVTKKYIPISVIFLRNSSVWKLVNRIFSWLKFHVQSQKRGWAERQNKTARALQGAKQQAHHPRRTGCCEDLIPGSTEDKPPCAIPETKCLHSLAQHAAQRTWFYSRSNCAKTTHLFPHSLPKRVPYTVFRSQGPSFTAVHCGLWKLPGDSGRHTKLGRGAPKAPQSSLGEKVYLKGPNMATASWNFSFACVDSSVRPIQQPRFPMARGYADWIKYWLRITVLCWLRCYAGCAGVLLCRLHCHTDYAVIYWLLRWLRWLQWIRRCAGAL